jgi:hypothetical protein
MRILGESLAVLGYAADMKDRGYSEPYIRREIETYVLTPWSEQVRLRSEAYEAVIRRGRS